MQLEDLTASNARAMMRRHDLVASYWPVMERLNLAEDVVAALTQQVMTQQHGLWHFDRAQALCMHAAGCALLCTCE